MRSIDIHAHLTPQCCIRAMAAGQAWHGIQPGSVRIAPRAVWTPEQRLAAGDPLREVPDAGFNGDLHASPAFRAHLVKVMARRAVAALA